MSVFWSTSTGRVTTGVAGISLGQVAQVVSVFVAVIFLVAWGWGYFLNFLSRSKVSHCKSSMVDSIFCAMSGTFVMYSEMIRLVALLIKVLASWSCWLTWLW